MSQPKKDRKAEQTRNIRLESQYSIDLRGERSVLAYVSRYADELVAAFEAWRGFHPEGEHRDAVLRWEAQRFGEQLYPAAHGVMAAAIRRGRC